MLSGRSLLAVRRKRRGRRNEGCYEVNPYGTSNRCVDGGVLLSQGRRTPKEEGGRGVQSPLDRLALPDKNETTAHGTEYNPLNIFVKKKNR